jgi:putative membrane protein
MLTRANAIAAVAVVAAPIVALAQSNQPDYPWRDWPPGAWHMMWGAGWSFWWLLPMLMMVVMMALCAIVMMRMFSGHHRDPGERDSALRILNERFARGEIQKAEFEEKRALLGRKP